MMVHRPRPTGLLLASRARLVSTDLGPDAAAADPPVPGRHVRCSRSRSLREAVERVRLRPRRRRCARRDPRDQAPPPARRRALVGSDGRAGARRSPPAHRSVGAVLVDGGISTLREAMDWATVKEQLAPPHLAGHAGRRVPRMIAHASSATPVEVTPRDRGDRPVGDARRPPTAGSDPACRGRTTSGSCTRSGSMTPMPRSRVCSVPTLAVLARGGGDPEWDERKRRAAKHGRPHRERPSASPGWRGSTTCRCSIRTRSRDASNVSSEQLVR